jgi:hypothetical protein
LAFVSMAGAVLGQELMVERSTSRRACLTRRALLVASASLLPVLVSQACAGYAGAHLSDEAASTPVQQRDDGQVTTTQKEPPAAQAARSASSSAPGLVRPQEPASVVAPPVAPRALVYLGLPDPDDPASIRAQPATLPHLIREPGQPWRLRGQLVEVVNHGVLVDRDPTTGQLRGVPMGDAETSAPEGFAFSPRSGGQLPWENERRGGADNSRIREAARFGEVNAYYYADRTLGYANGLLAELGEPPLPMLRVVVNAHSGSRLPGYLEDDGEIDNGKPQPFPGGHYRLPSIFKAEGRFLHPVEEMNPTGEVHLGPGRAFITDSRERTVVVDGRPYVRNASHVPGIIAHEVGHHVNGHTADFFANRARKPNEYVNRKIHMDEGTADYWAAVVLETPDIYNWQHAAEGRNDRDNRDLRGRRTTDDFDRDGDPHRNGNIWSSALWDVRTALGVRETDLLVMKMLVLFSKVGPEGSSANAIAQKIEQKDELRDGLAQLLKADEALYRGRNRAQLLKIFDRRGIDLTMPDRKFNRD